MLAIRMYVERNSYGSIVLVSKVNPQSVANLVSQYDAKPPINPIPNKPRKAEPDELYTFMAKKNRIYVLTIVERDMHCILNWDVVPERTTEVLQACLKRTPQAKQYYRDAFSVCDTL